MFARTSCSSFPSFSLRATSAGSLLAGIGSEMESPGHKRKPDENEMPELPEGPQIQTRFFQADRAHRADAIRRGDAGTALPILQDVRGHRSRCPGRGDRDRKESRRIGPDFRRELSIASIRGSTEIRRACSTARCRKGDDFPLGEWEAPRRPACVEDPRLDRGRAWKWRSDDPASSRSFSPGKTSGWNHSTRSGGATRISDDRGDGRR